MLLFNFSTTIYDTYIMGIYDTYIMGIHVIFNDLVVNSRYCNLSNDLPPDQQYLLIWKNPT